MKNILKKAEKIKDFVVLALNYITGFKKGE